MSASQVRHEALEIDAILRGGRGLPHAPAGNRDVRRVTTRGAKLMVQ
jgi:hypothetical protein